MYAFLGCYLAIQPPLKSLPGACDVTSFSPCTDSSHELQDVQHLDQVPVGTGRRHEVDVVVFFSTSLYFSGRRSILS